MKDILLLLALLIAQLSEVCPLPYGASSSKDCGNRDTYFVEESNLCCSKCKPGYHLVTQCTASTDSVCEPCGPGQYIENSNYAQNCLSCMNCKESKGLQYAQNCSSTTRSLCICKSEWYCSVGFNNPYCESCEEYTKCKLGQGVVRQGTATSNRKCKTCAHGTFSNNASNTDPCRNHTQCGRRAVLKVGTATEDTVCEPEAPIPSKQPPTSTSTKEPSTTATASLTAIALTTSPPVTSAQRLTESTHSHTQSSKPSHPNQTFSNSTKGKATDTGPGFHTTATICGVMVVLFLITIVLLFLCRSVYWKDSETPDIKVDRNENCESTKNGYIGETQMMTFTSQEQQYLLEKGEASSDYSQSSNNTETLTRTEGCSSHESIGPLQSTVANNYPSSALSEPLPLISTGDTAMSQPSSLTQSSSQPTSPQIINPVTTSPHVNVNITFHIGNGTCGTPSVMSTELKQADCKLPFGEEEESFSIPQQEDGKRSLMSVQESTNYCV